MFRRRHLSVLFFAAFFLGGCSGGGDDGGTPVPVAPSFPIALQRALVQANLVNYPAVIAQVSAGADIESFAIPNANAENAVRRRAGRRRLTDTGVCTDGTAFLGSSTPGAVTTFTLDLFYDQACTQPWQHLTGTDTIKSSTNTVTATGTIYGINGVAAQSETIDLSDTETESSGVSRSTFALGPSATNPTGGTFAVDCVDAGSQSQTETCSYGGEDAGIGFISSVADMFYPTGVGGTGNLTVDTGPSLSLENPVGSTPRISGATSSTTFAQTIVISYGTNVYPEIDIRTYGSDGGSTAASFVNFALTGQVIQNYGPTTDLETNTEATYDVDGSGNGTATYSDGSKAAIANFGFVAMAPSSSIRSKVH